MIFVTVGTHEQQFNRLVKYIDGLKGANVIDEEVIIQTGYSTYEPKYCTWSKLLPYSDMVKYVDKARIVITHGGPSSFIMPLQNGKTPIVVPRQKKYDEHVNDHQVDFSIAVRDRFNNIIVVEDIECLENSILNYDSLVKNKCSGVVNNNIDFNMKLENIVKGIFE